MLGKLKEYAKLLPNKPRCYDKIISISGIFFKIIYGQLIHANEIDRLTRAKCNLMPKVCWLNPNNHLSLNKTSQANTMGKKHK